MTYKIFAPAALAALALSACGPQKEPEVVGGVVDPQAKELAEAEPIDPATVPMRVGGDDYRCSGSNLLLVIDWIKTGEQMSARVTPQGEAGVTLIQGDGGAYTDGGDNTLTGSPTSDSVTFNGATCRK
ncbi:hypothetical protein [Sphingomicrobium clamense]|uniref:C-type lysozyme inhibitor domain-containing protein n=1 Tax=Sphingomicrobium clamense TaxID=2851013 RepID=A0ABS6V4A1_9SPHN|nr:hypothetical protein [Sphingomicrobium sp. B8]MBW0144389.1 hypothetical protein [Sphingomicrobium sp. B8]